VSIVGVVDVLRGRPRNPVGPDGRMALSDHFRELRARLIRSALILVIGFFVAIFFYDQLLDLVNRPYLQAQEALRRNDTRTVQVVQDATGGLLLQMKLCGVVAIMASSPYWLYQICAFILPGRRPKEKRYTRMFVAVAGPLFLGGVALGYYVMPKGLEVLISFVPNNVTSLVDFGRFFSFEMRMLLIFGVSMEIPLFVVLLSCAGIVSGRALAKHRPWIVIGTMVFAAVATPSTDPFSMLMLAVPMLILFAISEVICRVSDRIRGRGAHRTDQWADDQISPL
jgi:sec-independent protein translocase protein TatC